MRERQMWPCRHSGGRVAQRSRIVLGVRCCWFPSRPHRCPWRCAHGGNAPAGDGVGDPLADLLAHGVERLAGELPPLERGRLRGVADGRVLRDLPGGLLQLLVALAPGLRAQHVSQSQSGDEREPVAHDGHLSLMECAEASDGSDGCGTSACRRFPLPACGAGNRLAEHPPACANVCVAASARPLANTQGGTFDATRQSPVAQLAEQPAVNRQVTGSSPVGGASIFRSSIGRAAGC